MPRTPLAGRLAEAVSSVFDAHDRGLPVADVTEERRTTRRRFLRDAGAAAGVAAGALAAGPGRAGRVRDPRRPEVAAPQSPRR